MRKAVMTTLSCLFLAAAFPTADYAQTLVAGGQVVGIQIKTDGVMVAGVAPVETAEGSRSPAGDADTLLSEMRKRSLTWPSLTVRLTRVSRCCGAWMTMS